MRITFLTRYALAVLTATLLMAGAGVNGGVAWAHAALIGTDPAADSEVATAPATVSATFNEPMQPQFAAMTVVGPDGAQWGDGDPVVDGPVISVGVRPGAPAGDFTVNYRATSADGHVVSGSWTFRITTGAPAPASDPTEAPTSPAVQDDAEQPDAGAPVWPFVAGAVVLVALAGVWAVRRRR